MDKRFKAWNTVHKRWIEEGASHSNRDFYYPWGFQTGFDPCIIVQSTGQKDNKGIEVYEKDI